MISILSKMKTKLFTIIILFVIIFSAAFLSTVPNNNPSQQSAMMYGEVRAVASPKPPDQSHIANNDNDIEYLIFWPPLPGVHSSEDFEAGVRNFVTKMGTSGDGKTRQLGFGASIPIFVADESQIPQAIKGAFSIARRTNVAVFFNVDDHIQWDERPDLWNWYDPAKKGYNPNNRKNVEWYDWEGTPNKRRYFTPNGIPSQSPHMCYNSPAVRKEISRIVSQIVGPALRDQINQLKREHKEYLFAGIAVGAEAGIDDYSLIPDLSKLPSNPDPEQKQMIMLFTLADSMMEEDKAPHKRVGYCALTNAGYSKAHPPADINAALANINQNFIKFWDKQFYDAGIPRSRIYTHVAAQPAQDDKNNAPLGIVFNPYARPGWTTYPEGTLANGFQPLYDQLARHGSPAWGGVESNVALGNPMAPAPDWETYLAWHYNHGAKVVAVNIGTTEPSLMSRLGEIAFSDEALAAYRKFLSGGALTEMRQSQIAFSPQRFQQKIHLIQQEAPIWVQRSHRPDMVHTLEFQIDMAIKAHRFQDADKDADRLLQLIKGP